MSELNVVNNVGTLGAIAGWALKVIFTPDEETDITGRDIDFYAVNEDDDDDTFETADVTIDRTDATGVISVTIPRAITKDLLDQRFICELGFTDNDDAIGEFIAHFRKGGRPRT